MVRSVVQSMKIKNTCLFILTEPCFYTCFSENFMCATLLASLCCESVDSFIQVAMGIIVS